MKPWKKYQEDTAAYFRSIGLEAETDVTVKGVRTSHDVDVLVTSHFHGFDVLWVVECKLWQKPVNKLHVLGLREIVADIGADRGILLSESGFQSGAIEAANMTNIQVTSLDEVRESSSSSVYALRLRELFDRVVSCKDRYWELSKEQRIEYGLRPAYGEHNYFGDALIKMCMDILSRAFRNEYPFESEELYVHILFGGEKIFSSPKEVIELMDKLISELELKLDNCEQHARKA